MIAAVLAKRSVRFPGKHMTEFNGRTIVGHVVDRLKQSGRFERVIIMTQDPDIKDGNADVVIDNTKGTALDSIVELLRTYGEVFVVGGDMPCINPSFISGMVDSYSGVPVFPVHRDGVTEPLHGIYDISLLESLQAYLSTGKKSIRRFIEQCTHEAIAVTPEQENYFTNINYREDMEVLAGKKQA